VGPPRLGLDCDVDLFPNSLAATYIRHQSSPLHERFLAPSLSLTPDVRGFEPLHPRYKTPPTLNGLVGLVTPQTQIQDVEDLVYGMHDKRKPLAGHG
jgi:hypothetical protein